MCAPYGRSYLIWSPVILGHTYLVLGRRNGRVMHFLGGQESDHDQALPEEPHRLGMLHTPHQCSRFSLQDAASDFTPGVGLALPKETSSGHRCPPLPPVCCLGFRAFIAECSAIFMKTWQCSCKRRRDSEFSTHDNLALSNFEFAPGMIYCIYSRRYRFFYHQVGIFFQIRTDDVYHGVLGRLLQQHDIMCRICVLFFLYQVFFSCTYDYSDVYQGVLGRLLQ